MYLLHHTQFLITINSSDNCIIYELSSSCQYEPKLNVSQMFRVE